MTKEKIILENISESDLWKRMEEADLRVAGEKEKAGRIAESIDLLVSEKNLYFGELLKRGVQGIVSELE